MLASSYGSCESIASEVRYKRQDLVGKWRATDLSLPDHLGCAVAISGFELLADSIVIISFPNSRNKKGLWMLRSAPGFANKNISSGLGSDILIKYWNSQDVAAVYGLTCITKKGKLLLQGETTTFERANIKEWDKVSTP
jgi:hypothetical protein